MIQLLTKVYTGLFAISMLKNVWKIRIRRVMIRSIIISLRGVYWELLGVVRPLLNWGLASRLTRRILSGLLNWLILRSLVCLMNPRRIHVREWIMLLRIQLVELIRLLGSCIRRIKRLGLQWGTWRTIFWLRALIWMISEVWLSSIKAALCCRLTKTIEFFLFELIL